MIYCNPAVLAFFQFCKLAKFNASCLKAFINHPFASSEIPLVIVKIVSIKLY